MCDGIDNSNKRKKFDEEYIVKPRKLMSVVGAVHKRLDETNEEETAKASASNRSSKPDDISRNKRVFGALMGHLGKAKKMLEVDSTKIDRQSTVKNAATEKNKAESEKVLTIIRQKEQTEREKERMIREQFDIERKIRKLGEQFSDWKAKEEALENVFLTKAEPRLNWLPARYNDKTRQMLQDRKTEIARTVKEREDSDSDETKRLNERLDELVAAIREIEAAQTPRPRTDGGFGNDDTQKGSRQSNRETVGLEDGEEVERPFSSRRFNGSEHVDSRGGAACEPSNRAPTSYDERTRRVAVDNMTARLQRRTVIIPSRLIREGGMNTVGTHDSRVRGSDRVRRSGSDRASGPQERQRVDEKRDNDEVQFTEDQVSGDNGEPGNESRNTDAGDDDIYGDDDAGGGDLLAALDA